LLISGFTWVEAFLAGLVAPSVTGFAILAWHTRQGKPTLATAIRRAELSAAAVHLDSQAASILASVRTHLDAGQRYSVSLAQGVSPC
jgi:hypothetical protein